MKKNTAKIDSPAEPPKQAADSGEPHSPGASAGDLSPTDKALARIEELRQGAGWTVAKLTKYLANEEAYKDSRGDLTKLSLAQLQTLTAYLNTQQTTRPLV